MPPPSSAWLVLPARAGTSYLSKDVPGGLGLGGFQVRLAPREGAASPVTRGPSAHGFSPSRPLLSRSRRVDGSGGSPTEVETLPGRAGVGAPLRRGGVGRAAGGRLAGDGRLGPADLPGRRGRLLQPALVGLLALGQPGGAAGGAARRRGAGLAERRRLEPGELARPAVGSPRPRLQRPLLAALRLRPVSGRPAPRPLRRLHHQRQRRQHQQQPGGEEEGAAAAGATAAAAVPDPGPDLGLGRGAPESQAGPCPARLLLFQRRHRSLAGFTWKLSVPRSWKTRIFKVIC